MIQIEMEFPKDCSSCPFSKIEEIPMTSLGFDIYKKFFRCTLNGNGEEKTIPQLSKEYNIPYKTLYQRLAKYNWSLEKSISLSIEESIKTPTRIRILTFNNISLPLSKWAEKYNLHPKTLAGRIDNGWDFEKALTTPVRRKKLKNIA